MTDDIACRVVDDLNTAAKSGRAEDVVRILGNMPPGTILPLETLKDLPDLMSAHVNGSVVTMPYSGVLGIDEYANNAILQAWHAGEFIGSASDGKVATIGQTDVFDLLMSSQYRDSLERAAGTNYKSVYAQQWHDQSSRFIKANQNPQVSITPFALDNAVYAKSELPTSYHQTNTPSYEGILRQDYAPIIPESGSTVAMRETTSLLSAHNVGDIVYGYDEAGRLHLDTHEFWGDKFPEIPRQSLPANVKEYRTVASVAMGASAEQARTLGRGLTGLETIAGHSDTGAKLLQEIRETKWLAGLAKGGKASVIATVALSGVSLALTRHALAAQRDLADDYAAKGQLGSDPETLKEYKQLLDDMQPFMETAASDPFVVTSLGQTALVETSLHQRYSEFLNAHRDISPQVAAALQPGMVHVDSLQEKISDVAYDNLPDDPSLAPAALQNLARATQDMKLAGQAFELELGRHVPMKTIFDIDPTPPALAALKYPAVQEAGMVLNNKIITYQAELGAVMATPEGVQALTEAMNNKQLLAMVEATAPHYKGEAMDPLVKQYLDTADDKREEWRGNVSVQVTAESHKDAVAALSARPDVMRGFLQDVFKPPAPDMPTQTAEMGAPESTHPLLVNDVDAIRIERGEEYSRMAIPLANMRDGIELHPLEEQDMLRILAKPDDPQVPLLAGQRFPDQVGAILHKQEQERLDAQLQAERQRTWEEEQRLQAAARAAEQEQKADSNDPFALPGMKGAQPSMALGK
ncbi:MAG: hypothetical protein KDI13_00910 [Alphaproteobacteria bacterium]|nr:hypothetical protein [Alphaproteobacteria bacterium]